ncbi:DUF1752-domain-containing protein [Saccharata proteae CBS 121410]|uniref:DUF1752-domain-containing protein n=1 Tax=Saccharata proteae CBS 121410 TaxID=1314787 RepID=A0A9P4I1E2_9PEZI|nr:DUF1752-domain-containing protein [Saccharata proteae CBS 121410]
MPFRSQVPLLQVEPGAITTVDTSSAEQLFGLWSIFSKCSGAMDDGRRLENLSWRLWTRETFCCAPERKPILPPRWSFSRKNSMAGFPVPALSSSIDSDDSDDLATHATASSSRPEIRRLDSTESYNKGFEKHITPLDLGHLVTSIQEKKDTTPRLSTPPPRIVPESSTSTVATAIDSDASKMSPPVGSETSDSTDCSSHSVVRGFTPGRVSVSSSLRSKTNLQSAPAPILKPNPTTRPEPIKRKGAMFTLGGSSDEGGESSLETHMQMSNTVRSSLSDGLKRPAMNRKTTSFKDEVVTRTIPDMKAYESEEVFETDSEDDDVAVSESAIDDDDEDDEDEDDDQWEDSDEDESGPASAANHQVSFHRVDSKPNLTSRRSLLTSLMHEGDRAQALQNAASKSTPAIRRSRTSSPNGPLVAESPSKETAQPPPTRQQRLQPPQEAQIPRSKPIIMTTSNTHATPALSPRTTRRNMLTTELTESLRKHLLWERQQKNSTSNAVLKRRHTSTDVKNLKNYPNESQAAPLSRVKEQATKGNNSWTTNYFDTGLQEYHERGW